MTSYDHKSSAKSIKSLCPKYRGDVAVQIKEIESEIWTSSSKKVQVYF